MPARMELTYFNLEPTAAQAMVLEVSESRKGRIWRRARIWKYDEELGFCVMCTAPNHFTNKDKIQPYA